MATDAERAHALLTTYPYELAKYEHIRRLLSILANTAPPDLQEAADHHRDMIDSFGTVLVTVLQDHLMPVPADDASNIILATYDETCAGMICVAEQKLADYRRERKPPDLRVVK